MVLQNFTNWRRDTPRAFNAAGNVLSNECIVHLSNVMAKACSATTPALHMVICRPWMLAVGYVYEAVHMPIARGVDPDASRGPDLLNDARESQTIVWLVKKTH